MRLQLLITLIALTLLEAMLSTGFYYGLTRDYPGANDFYVPWFGSKALWTQGRDPYSPDVTRDLQKAFPFDTAEHSFSFAYPLYATFLIAPIAWLPYDVAEAIWLAFTFSLLLGSGLLTLRNLDLTLKPWALAAITLWLIAFYPNARTLLLGQLAAVVLACVVGAWWCIRMRHDAWAGALLAFSTIKPQMMILLLPLILVWAWQQRRHTLWLSFAIALGVLCLISFIILPTWLFSFVQTAITYTGYFDSRSPLQIILNNNTLASLASIVLVGVLFFAAWRTVQPCEDSKPSRGSLRVAMWSIILTQFIAVHTATTNQIMLMLPIFSGLAHLGSIRRARALIVVWLLLLLIVPWWVFLATKQGNLENEVALLPLSLGVCVWWLLMSPLSWKDRGERSSR
jgi:hypothetical protein